MGVKWVEDYGSSEKKPERKTGRWRDGEVHLQGIDAEEVHSRFKRLTRAGEEPSFTTNGTTSPGVFFV